MRSKLLAAVAFLGLGIGCDDPEVQGKVADLMQYGAVQAELKCENVEFWGLCGNSPTADIAVFKFVDGSSTFKLVTAGPHATSAFQFNPKGYPLEVSSLDHSSGEFSLTVDSGLLTFESQCSNPPWNSEISVDLALESCTGRNLEAFGIE